jgi:hypothetical protein
VNTGWGLYLSSLMAGCAGVFSHGDRSWFHPEVDDVLLLPGAVLVS